MRPDLDPTSPVPLYHQIAQDLRLRVLSGELAPGTLLPPLRAAARDLGVNLHTIRHAYTELARDGLVESRSSAGTRVLPRPSGPGATDPLGRFVQRSVQIAWERHGLSPDQLARAVLQCVPGPPGRAGGRVHVLECSAAQCEDLAAQIRQRFQVDAVPWSLEQDQEPPVGPLIATYFHYNEVRRRWPTRFREVDFVGIHPDPGLCARLEAAAPGSRTITLCEWDQPTAETVAADLTALLPPGRFKLRLVIETAAERALARGRGPVLFSPRVWARLPAAARSSARALPLRYVFDEPQLAAIAAQRRWRSA